MCLSYSYKRRQCTIIILAPACISRKHTWWLNGYSYGCAAGVIALGLFNDAINVWVNRGACWDKSQRLGSCPDTTRTRSHRVHMFADIINSDSLISFTLCLLLAHKYTDVGCFSINCIMCCAPFLMRKIISQLFIPQLHTIPCPRGA